MCAHEWNGERNVRLVRVINSSCHMKAARNDSDFRRDIGRALILQEVPKEKEAFVLETFAGQVAGQRYGAKLEHVAWAGT